jgi:2'-hydroxyisoflavone reductase
MTGAFNEVSTRVLSLVRKSCANQSLTISYKLSSTHHSGSISNVLSGMEILVLGGTRFVGRHIVEEALRRGHGVSTLTRGNNPLKGTNSLIGDRRGGDLRAIEGMLFDAVIDVNAYIPREVKQAAEILKGATRHYTFISTISVYSPKAGSVGEDDPLLALTDPTTEEVSNETYGGLKVLCEQEAETAFPGLTQIIRPHLVVGPHDPTDRFTYWPRRFARGGEVVLPGNPDVTLQYVDARDQACFVMDGVEQGRSGTFNSCARPVAWGELVEAARAAGLNFTPVWVDERFLMEQKVQPWADLPAWVPSFDENRGLLNTNNSKALQAGMKIRPLADTFKDVLEWDRTREGGLSTGLSAEREVAVLEAWRMQDRV